MILKNFPFTAKLCARFKDDLINLEAESSETLKGFLKSKFIFIILNLLKLLISLFKSLTFKINFIL